MLDHALASKRRISAGVVFGKQSMTQKNVRVSLQPHLRLVSIVSIFERGAHVLPNSCGTDCYPFTMCCRFHQLYQTHSHVVSRPEHTVATHVLGLQELHPLFSKLSHLRHITEMFPLTLLSMLALASPISAASYSSTISAADLEKISPDTSSCEGADFPDECATAAQAAPFIDISFSNFGIESFGGQAALVAIMLFESGVSVPALTSTRNLS